MEEGQVSKRMLCKTWSDINFHASYVDEEDSDTEVTWCVSLSAQQALIQVHRVSGNGNRRLIQEEYKAVTIFQGHLMCWAQSEKAWMDMPPKVQQAFCDYVAEQELLRKDNEKDTDN